MQFYPLPFLCFPWLTLQDPLSSFPALFLSCFPASSSWALASIVSPGLCWLPSPQGKPEGPITGRTACSHFSSPLLGRITSAASQLLGGVVQAASQPISKSCKLHLPWSKPSQWLSKCCNDVERERKNIIEMQCLDACPTETHIHTLHLSANSHS